MEKSNEASVLKELADFIVDELRDRGYGEIVLEYLRDKKPSTRLQGILGDNVAEASSFSPHICVVYRTSEECWRKATVTLIKGELTIMDISKSRASAELIEADTNLLITTESIPIIIKRFFNHSADHPLLHFSRKKRTSIGAFKEGVLFDWYPSTPEF